MKSSDVDVSADELVIANHILAGKAIVDAFGHVSVRCADNREQFLLARNLAPQLVTRNDILRFDLDGNCLSEPGARVYLERFIHGEIYRVRPDVHSVVHAHAASVIPFAAVPAKPVRPVYHMSAFIGPGLPVFEIRDCVAHSDMLIRSPDLGVALARGLGGANGILMRGHGFTVVGTSLHQAVYRAVYLDLNARIQATAESLGDPVFLDAGEAAAAEAMHEGQLRRPWELWARETVAMLSHEQAPSE